MPRLFHQMVFCLAVTTAAFGQPPVPIPKNNHYEVVSIKRGLPGKLRGVHFHPGEFWLDNYPLPDLITAVYGVSRDHVFGLPPWTSSETYSFRAKSVAPANPAEQWAMLTPVLKDRFKLKYHREKREMPVYYLSVQASGVQFPVTVPGGCTPIDLNADAQSAAPAASKKPTEPRPPNDCGRFLFEQLREGGVRLTVKAVTMAQLAESLRRFLGRPVVDRTGSSKLYDVDLSFDNRVLTVSDTDPPSMLPTIPAALKKAGLSLTGGRDAVEVLLIDRLERPSEN